MGFNLYTILPEQDKVILTNYITEYGVSREYFMGLEKWLKPWGKDKIKMYHLLGDKLIYSAPYEYLAPDSVIINAIDDLMWESYHRHFIQLCIKLMLEEREKNEALNNVTDDIRNDIFSARAVFKNSLVGNIVLNWKENKKPVTLSKGMKIMKVIPKYIKYMAKDEDHEKALMSEFEEFRLEHSRILNTRKITGELCFSIHPMDFLTMSDNSYNWSSCMNWTDNEGRKYSTGGCYRVGSTEMMFSNCVICCYLKTKEPYYFMSNELDHNEDYAWNNKKWRQLFYVTKDIIISGKSYPYENEEITIKALEELRNLAFENLNWKYSFGPEEYLDMKGVYGEDGFDLARIKNNNQEMYKTSNILFETRGMYNDMVNDHHRKFLCVRNKVKRNKIINISGKSRCLCCGNEVAYLEECPEEYNDRYQNTNSIICCYCKDKYFKCSHCGESYTYKPKFAIFDDKQYCGYCQGYMKKCPSGNGDILFTYSMTDSQYARMENLVVGHYFEDLYNVEVSEDEMSVALRAYDDDVEDMLKRKYVALFMSEKHKEELIESGAIVKSSSLPKRIPFKLCYPWSRVEEFWVMVKPMDKEMEKYYYVNLEDFLQ